MDGDKEMVLGSLIGGFIVIIVGVNLVPVIGNSIEFAQTGDNQTTQSNVSSTSATLLDITEIFFAIGVMAAGVGLAMTGLRESGLV